MCSAELIREEKFQAGMASFAEYSVRVIKYKSVATVDCGPSTLTGLQTNTTSVEEIIPSSSRHVELGFNQV